MLALRLQTLAAEAEPFLPSVLIAVVAEYATRRESADYVGRKLRVTKKYEFIIKRVLITVTSVDFRSERMPCSRVRRGVQCLTIAKLLMFEDRICDGMWLCAACETEWAAQVGAFARRRAALHIAS